MFIAIIFSQLSIDLVKNDEFYVGNTFLVNSG